MTRKTILNSLFSTCLHLMWSFHQKDPRFVYCNTEYFSTRRIVANASIQTVRCGEAGLLESMLPNLDWHQKKKTNMLVFLDVANFPFCSIANAEQCWLGRLNPIHDPKYGTSLRMIMEGAQKSHNQTKSNCVQMPLWVTTIT